MIIVEAASMTLAVIERVNDMAETQVVGGKTIGAALTVEEIAQVKGFADGALAAAITAGDVTAVWGNVHISEKASPTGKAADKEYVSLGARTLKGMAFLCGGKVEPQTPKPEDGEDTRTEQQKEPGASDYFNYGFDLDLRQPVRNTLMGTLEGPEKAVKAAVKGLLAMGLEGDALRTAIKNSPKFKDVEGIDKFIDAALKG